MKYQQASTNKRRITKPFIIAGVIVLVVGVLGWAGYAYYNNATANDALEVTKPIEKALTNTGAVTVCRTGDNGRGVDNRQPWSTIYLESSLDFQHAEEAITTAAKENGFEIKKASAGTKGYLGDVVYTDSKSSSDGATELAVALTNSAPLHACSPKLVQADSQHTAISLELRLPSR